MPTTDTLIEHVETEIAEPEVSHREILGLVAQGGFARVYLARNVESNSFEALKVLHAQWAESAEARERFSREAINAAAVRHRNVVRVIERGVTSTGTPFLAMEYVEGPTLADVIKRQPRFPVARACAIALEIAAALSAAHRLGIVHRDLTPSNILLATAHGRDPLMNGTVKIADFGLARAMRDPAQQVTRAGITLGTLAYMSPEQLISGELADARSDIFALGCIFHEMLTGTKLFGDDPLVRRSRGRPEGVRKVRHDVTRQMERLVLHAVESQPERRFPSALAFASALRSTIDRRVYQPAVVGIAAACLGLSVLALPGMRRRTSSDALLLADTERSERVALGARSPAAPDFRQGIEPVTLRAEMDTVSRQPSTSTPIPSARAITNKRSETAYERNKSISETPSDSMSAFADLFAVAGTTAPPPPPVTDTRAPVFIVQFAAVLSWRVADSLASSILVEGLQAHVISSIVRGDSVYRVVIGPFTAKDEAERVARASVRDAWVYQR